MSPVRDPNGARRTTVDDDVGADLMRRVEAGDAAAFRELVDRYRGSVLRTVHRYCGDRARAEELTQDVFVRVYRARERYERKAKFETWLYRIVFNLCANAADYQRRRRTLSLDRSTEDGEPRGARIDDPESVEPLAALERDELRQRVREAIDRLPEQQRAALVLSRYRGMPHQEIAEALETTGEAVKSLLFRARENLRTMLSPYVREEARDERT